MDYFVSILYFLGNWAWPILIGIDKSRMVEGFIFLAVCWVKVRPHLEKIETRMHGIEIAFTDMTTKVETGFKAGESRFKLIENRLDVIEKPETIKPQTTKTALGGPPHEQTI